MADVLFVCTEKYFDMKKNQCKDALDIYKKFLYRMTKLSEFLKVAEVRTVLFLLNRLTEARLRYSPLVLLSE